MLSQMGTPDMRTPISFTLAYPERIKTNVKRLNLHEIQKLTFLNLILKIPMFRIGLSHLNLEKVRLLF